MVTGVEEDAHGLIAREITNGFEKNERVHESKNQTPRTEFQSTVTVT